MLTSLRLVSDKEADFDLKEADGIQDPVHRLYVKAQIFRN